VLRHILTVLLAATVLVAQAGELGRAGLTQDHSPLPWRSLDGRTQAAFTFGSVLFNTSWVAAGTPDASNHDGLGPLYNAASCDECHNGTGAARAIRGSGELPATVVVQLNRKGTDDIGDPVYGHLLSTDALAGFQPEARVSVNYSTVKGRYADGMTWRLRRPHYTVTELSDGPLAAHTVISVRVAPTLYGVGLLDQVSDAAIENIAAKQARTAAATGIQGILRWHTRGGQRQLGRFGWQNVAVSVADQTARALSREMGLTNPRIDHDDCTAQQTQCLNASSGGEPEVSAAFFTSLLAYQHWLGVPASAGASLASMGRRAFKTVGCDACHRPTLPMAIDGKRQFIHPYTDLLLHNLGDELDDHTAGGQPVRIVWRTAPLWGLHVGLQRPGGIALLHDGRARSVAEAVLWHGGEAARSRERFEDLPKAERTALLAWIDSL